MKFAAATALLAATAAIASPVQKRAVTDTDILQYALTLEHLEDVFYHEYLTKFSAADFTAAGYPDWVRNRIVQIAGHEGSHVALLTGAIGATAVKECSYKFPVTDVKSFLGLATVVENVGVSAYLGAAAFITNKAYVTVAGSILTTEARHQAWMNSAVAKNAPFSGAYDTPLDFNEVYSIASAFITGCPASNPPLPFKAFPSLVIAADGTLTTTAATANSYVQLVDGLYSKTFPVVNGKVVGLPTPQGITYGILTSQSNSSLITDDNILAGPMIFNNPFTSKVANPDPAY